MKDTSEIVACVIDHGQFSSVARRLAKDYKQVYYCCPDEMACRVVAKGVLGDGFLEFEKVRTIKEVKSKCDLFVFPDVGFYWEQAELREQGKAVWGAGDGGMIEENRGFFLRLLKEVGLPVAKHDVVVGLENLRAFLRGKEDKYIKVSWWRGDIETTHWRSWDQDSCILDAWAVRLNRFQRHMTFYVFDPIPAAIEDGFDTFCIDGKMPNTVMHGQENKDKSFIGVMSYFGYLPENLREIAQAFLPVLKRSGYYRQAFSIEARNEFFIDPTLRFPSPPHQLELEQIENFGEIVWAGANGEVVEPVVKHKCGVQALVRMERDETEWGNVVIPESIKDYVYPMYVAQEDDVLCFPPGGLGPMIAWITGTGNTVEEAIHCLQERKSELPDCVECLDKSLAELLQNLKSSESKPDVPIPDPEIVLEEKG